MSTAMITSTTPSRPPSSPLSRPRVSSADTLAAPPSPKRSRQTPSPSTHTSSSTRTTRRPPPSSPSGSSQSRSRPARPSLADKRAVTFDRHVMTSHSHSRCPSVGPGLASGGSESGHSSRDGGRLVRRRELSVPIVSRASL